MSLRSLTWLCLCLSLTLSPDSLAKNRTPPPLKALFITGGPYHDYKNLIPLLTAKTPEFANISWDVKWGPETLKDPEFGSAYDAVAFSMCFDETDPPSMDNILKLASGGKPMVIIHCAVHSFKVSDEWRRMVGEVSKVHDRYQAFSAEKVDAGHPIMKSFPDQWQTAGDELYQTIEMGPESKSLLKVKSPSSGAEHIVCWTNQYGKGRIFGTTLGHDMKTAQQADYQRLVAYGLLWACGKLDSDGKPAKGYEGNSNN